MIRRQNENSLRFKWQESGGPPVVPPTRQGFGTTLLKATFPDAQIDYAVEGLSCEIDIPLGASRGPSGHKLVECFFIFSSSGNLAKFV
jgi:two-component sensor histidine kinase